METPTLKLAVIVAAQDAGGHLQRCLSALAPQLVPGEMEAIVVDGSKSGGGIAIAADFPAIRSLRAASTSNVPQLWAAGIAASQGAIVALTIENCVPAHDWVSAILTAHAAQWPCIGGAIELAPDTGVADWAVYFSRYSASMLPFPVRFLNDVPGDNCSYKRDALVRVEHLMGEGFWESLIHHDMRRRDERLLSDPSLVVAYSGGLSARRFCRRRFIHGRYFAARRGANFTTLQKLLRSATFPAVPVLLFWRMFRRIWRQPKHRLRFVAAVPLIGCFLIAWAAGEAVGYVARPSDSPQGD